MNHRLELNDLYFDEEKTDNSVAIYHGTFGELGLDIYFGDDHSISFNLEETKKLYLLLKREFERSSL